jgi:hypothetical protein
LGQPPEYGIRSASHKDIAGIFAILESVLAEVPVLLDTDERRRLILEMIEGYCAQRTSWVVLDQADSIIGFLLGENLSIKRPWMQFDGITLPYGGVLRDHQRHGHFSNLIAQAKTIGKPLRAVVKRANKSCMAARLVKMGFVKKAGYALRQDEDVFIWTPP